MVISEIQTDGYGVSGKWESHEKNLYASFTTNIVDNLSIRASLISYYYIKEYIKNIILKIPNDIYYKKDKLSGVIVEDNIIGIGINFNGNDNIGINNITKEHNPIDIDLFVKTIKKVMKIPKEEIQKTYQEIALKDIDNFNIYIKNDMKKIDIKITEINDNKLITKDKTYHIEQLKFLIK